MGETRVDLQHLLEDLRDAYVGSIEETVLTEIVANSLDSGASRIQLETDAASSMLLVRDNGAGMKRRDLARYHDIASSTKARGQGIGFAGVGIKLGLLLREEVLTETRRGKSHVASRWHLASRTRAPWKWVTPPDRVGERGTTVSLRLTHSLSPLLDVGFLEGVLRRHYQPLFEACFGGILSDHYPQGISFDVNGRRVAAGALAVAESAPVEVRIGRKRKPSAVGYLAVAGAALADEARGVAISTLGKVIKRGWDWLGVSPPAPERIGGVIEVPALAGCLTLSKSDFVRSGLRGATYLSYRKAIQEAVSRQLAQWGHVRDGAEDARRRSARPVERDVERVLVELADEFPLLATLVERREGGQRRLPIGAPGRAADARSLIAAAVVGASEAIVPATATALAEPPVPAERAPVAGEEPGRAEPEPAAATIKPTAIPGARGPRRPGRYGLSIQFESREGEGDLARLVESTVWVNDAHPAYRRAVASRSEGYHLALSVAMALAVLAVEPASERRFVAAFIEQWGRALESGNKRQRTLF